MSYQKNFNALSAGSQTYHELAIKTESGKSHQISKTSLRRFLEVLNLYRGIGENVSGRGDLFDEWTSSLS